MAYSADSFVADEQPTTAKWNKLWTNDASFNDGTGIGTAAIGSSKIDFTSIPANPNAWTSYTPTISANTGTFTSTSATGSYWQFGKTIVISVQVTVTTVGTGAGLLFTVPVTALSTNMVIGNCRETVTTGLMYNVSLASATTAILNRYDNSGSISSGSIFRIFATYQAA